MPTPSANTTVEILNKNLELVATPKVFYPLNRDGMILNYSTELSDFGLCKFRIATQDPILTQFGNILLPHQYHVRIKRGDTVVWRGGIVDNPDRNSKYIEVSAAEYDFYLGKVLIHRDAETTSGDGRDNYRTFSSGTMKTAVTNLVTDAKNDFGSNHPLNGLVISSANIENPDYPAGFSDASGNALTGGWNFSDYITLQFDYHSVLYVLKAFGIYTNTDFEIDEDLNFYFKKFIGRKQTGVTFRYGTFGNIVDYNAPLLGRRMVNDLWGIAADDKGKVLHVEQKDTTSVNTYGLLQDAEAFADVKAKNFLKKRTNESLNLQKTPDDSPLNLLLNEKAYTLGLYGLGDIVTVQIKDHVIDINTPRRIVGITVNLHNTGREMITVQTNKPNESDLGN